jgi:hypothetical protein
MIQARPKHEQDLENGHSNSSEKLKQELLVRTEIREWIQQFHYGIMRRALMKMRPTKRPRIPLKPPPSRNQGPKLWPLKLGLAAHIKVNAKSQWQKKQNESTGTATKLRSTDQSLPKFSKFSVIHLHLRLTRIGDCFSNISGSKPEKKTAEIRLLFGILLEFRV